MGASLRMIADGDVAAALAPCFPPAPCRGELQPTWASAQSAGGARYQPRVSVGFASRSWRDASAEPWASAQRLMVEGCEHV
jgi:hypothetical protein